MKEQATSTRSPKFARSPIIVLALALFTGVLSAQTITIPVDNANTASDRKPLGGYFGYERTHMLFTASEVGIPGTITAIGFYVNSLSSPAATTPVVIRMKIGTGATVTSATYDVASTGSVITFSGDITSSQLNADSWVTIPLSTPFNFAAGNLEVFVETNGGGTGIELGTAKQFRWSAPLPPAMRCQTWQADNAAPISAGSVNSNRPNIQLTITPAPACDALPAPGNTTGPASICANNPFTVSLQNNVAGTGVTYLWESAADGTTWSAAPGFNTGNDYNTSQTEITWYRCQVTCAGHGTTASVPLQITMNPYTSCYCIPTGAGNNGDEIINFTLAGLNHSSPPSQGTNGYANYADSVAAALLTAGASYTATVTGGAGSGNHGAAIWIDYNDNGQFDDDEKVAAIASTIAPNTTGTFPAFTVPLATGVHRLRVQYAYNRDGSTLAPCTVATQFAETEDYLVNISGEAGILNQVSRTSVTVHPNPASSDLFINTATGLPVHAKIYDMLGHLALEAGSTTKLNVGCLAPGSYSLLLTDSQGQVMGRTRFVKQ